MKKCIACILAAMVLALCACAREPAPTETAQDPYAGYPTIHQKLTWDAINAIPIKHENMTTGEMRDLCVQFFEFSKTALWIPDRSWSYIKNENGSPDEMIQGQIYGGLPYVGVASGNIYRLMDYIDEKSGVVDMTEPIANPKLFGNQCSIGSYWGWARVINSADYDWTFGMVHNRGFLRVGPYTYDDSKLRFQEGVFETPDVIEENGSEIMCLSYAQMLHGDGLVTSHAGGGHAMMCYTDPVVVYAADGTVDGNQSYLHIIDQHSNWSEATNEAGDTFLHKNFIGKKFTFNELMIQGYIPFTFAEFLGTDPVEPTEVTFSHSGATITPMELNNGTVTANYGISDIYALVKDAKGNTVHSIVRRADTAGKMELNFFKLVKSSDWEAYTGGEYTLEVVCQLGTGERLTIYTGQLVK
jgi:hypothetical protein